MKSTVRLADEPAGVKRIGREAGLAVTLDARRYDRDGRLRMWLHKAEPSGYGYVDLEREGKARWDGVKNPVAQANLRKMKEGDAVFIYHTGDEKAVVGTALVTREAYPDPKNEGLSVVDLAPTGRLARAVTLAD